MRFDDAFPPIWGRIHLQILMLQAWHVRERMRTPDAVHGVCRACGVQRSAMNGGEGSVREDPSAAAHAGVRHGPSFTSRAAFFMGAESRFNLTSKVKRCRNPTQISLGPPRTVACRRCAIIPIRYRMHALRGYTHLFSIT